MLQDCGFSNQEVKMSICGGFDVAGDINGQEGLCPHKKGSCYLNEEQPPAAHDQRSTARVKTHAFSLLQEMYLGMCYKKCSDLTDGAYTHRISAFSCCNNENILACNPFSFGTSNVKSAVSFNAGGKLDSSPHNPVPELTESSSPATPNGAAPAAPAAAPAPAVANRFAGLPDTRGFRVKAETSQLDGREALVLDYSHARHGDPLWGRVLFMRDELRQGPAPGVLLGLGAMGATGGMWNCAPFVLVPEMPEATEEQQAVGEQLREILRGHGFVYAFGLLSSAEIAEAFHGAKGFWAPDVDRAALPRLTPETNVGYGGLGNEALNARRQADLKEAFNLRKVSLTDGSLPAVKDFPSYCQRRAGKLREELPKSAQRALLAFGVALQLEDPKHFARSVVQWDLCTMRLLHYPPGIAHCDEGSGSAIACGEHTDFGAVTVLLVEDGVRGLEVRTPDGKWISAPGKDAATPWDALEKEGAVVLNTGAMLARWCNDFVKATPHRVISTEEDRYSIVFFCDPDRGEVLETWHRKYVVVVPGGHEES
eukprot:g28214.t1